MAVLVDEEIRGLNSYDIHITDRYVELNNGTNQFRAFLDEDGWKELQLIVTEVCVNNDFIQ